MIKLFRMHVLIIFLMSTVYSFVLFMHFIKSIAMFFQYLAVSGKREYV